MQLTVISIIYKALISASTAPIAWCAVRLALRMQSCTLQPFGYATIAYTWAAQNPIAGSACLTLGALIFYVQHPTTIRAMYALYWIIPAFTQLLCTVKKIYLSHKELSLLASIAHANLTCHVVGTLCWTMVHTSTDAYWQGLMSTVWLEQSIETGLIFLTMHIIGQIVHTTIFQRLLHKVHAAYIALSTQIVRIYNRQVQTW